MKWSPGPCATVKHLSIVICIWTMKCLQPQRESTSLLPSISVSECHVQTIESLNFLLGEHFYRGCKKLMMSEMNINILSLEVSANGTAHCE